MSRAGLSLRHSWQPSEIGHFQLSIDAYFTPPVLEQQDGALPMERQWDSTLLPMEGNLKLKSSRKFMD